MKARDYYLHKSGGFAFDYFGGFGRPYQVKIFCFYFIKLLGYKATRVVRGASIKRVYIRATLAIGAHRHSWAMEKVLQEKI
jgi:hypothetical protein